MKYAKTQCVGCPHYHLCPPAVRALVNYCGRLDGPMKERIREAQLQCNYRVPYHFHSRMPERTVYLTMVSRDRQNRETVTGKG